MPKTLVAKTAIEQKVSPSDAARRLVDDAVAAVAARDRGLDTRSPTSWNLRSARARITIDRVRGDARSAGPPTEEEIKELSARHWREVDRPESASVVHFVVMRSNPPGSAPPGMPPKPADPAFDARAKALAVAMRGALVGATSTEDFLEKAKAHPHPQDLTVTAEGPFPPIIEDGSSIEPGLHLDGGFSKAALALPKPGDTSPVVETPFGWHVIRLVERFPEQRMPFEERRLAFTELAYSVRAEKALKAVIAPLRAANPVTIEPSAEQLMRSALVSGEQ